MFVAIDGLDAVGKTTLAKALAENLRGEAMDTPGPALRPLRDGILEALGDDQAARCLFYAASVLAQGRRAREIADRGGVVVMDRYWLSTISYARARGLALDLSVVEAVVPRPDVSILLTLDEGERVRRLRSRGATAADIETLEDRFRDAVMREIRRPSRERRLLPIEIDVSGADPREAVQRVLSALPRQGTRSRGAGGRKP